MLDAIRSFVADLAAGDRQGSDLDDNDHRVAVAALLVHAAAIDGSFSKPERDRLGALLRRHFDLEAAEAASLIEQATAAEREAVDLYRFTRVLIHALDENQRLRLIEMMWEIALSDGKINEYESNLAWRVADLLGVPSHERIALRQRVKAARGGGRA